MKFRDSVHVIKMTYCGNKCTVFWQKWSSGSPKQRSARSGSDVLGTLQKKSVYKSSTLCKKPSFCFLKNNL